MVSPASSGSSCLRHALSADVGGSTCLCPQEPAQNELFAHRRKTVHSEEKGTPGPAAALKGNLATPPSRKCISDLSELLSPGGTLFPELVVADGKGNQGRVAFFKEGAALVPRKDR